MAPLIPLFWTSGDVSTGFQSQSGQPYLHLVEARVTHTQSFTFGVTPADRAGLFHVHASRHWWGSKLGSIGSLLTVFCRQGYASWVFNEKVRSGNEEAHKRGNHPGFEATGRHHLKTGKFISFCKTHKTWCQLLVIVTGDEFRDSLETCKVLKISAILNVTSNPQLRLAHLPEMEIASCL